MIDGNIIAGLIGAVTVILVSVIGFLVKMVVKNYSLKLDGLESKISSYHEKTSERIEIIERKDIACRITRNSEIDSMQEKIKNIEDDNKAIEEKIEQLKTETFKKIDTLERSFNKKLDEIKNILNSRK